jgi:hypothetical protein
MANAELEGFGGFAFHSQQIEADVRVDIATIPSREQQGANSHGTNAIRIEVITENRKPFLL